jgi:hypothetical protein
VPQSECPCMSCMCMRTHFGRRFLHTCSEISKMHQPRACSRYIKFADHAQPFSHALGPSRTLLGLSTCLRLGASSLRRRRTMLHETFESSSRGLQRVLEPDCVYMRTTEIVAHQILARAQISVVAIFVSSSTLPWKLASWSRDCTHDRTP